MSEREQLATIIGTMDEIYVTDIYHYVIERLSELMHKQKEDAEIADCKRIFEECENDDDEPMPFNEYAAQLKAKWSDNDDADEL